MEVASAHFVLHNKKKRNGRQKHVGSEGSKEYSARDVGFTKVRGVLVINKACTSREAKVPLVAVCVCAGAMALVLAAVLLYRRATKYKHRALTSDSDEHTGEYGI